MIIYKVTNLINDKVYIGLTTETLEKRKNKHYKYAFKENGNGIFQKALRKYGEENFTWEIIDTAETLNELNEKEMYWIAFYNTFINSPDSNGYNMTIGGGGTKGYTLSNETKEKISLINKGKKHSDETKKKKRETTIKNGSQKGSNNPSAKLTEDEILQIKELIKERIPINDIAIKFNVKRETISSIKRGKNWSHIGDDVSKVKSIKNKGNKLTENDVKEIKLLLNEGNLTQQEIANIYNISRVSVNDIKIGKTWKYII